MFIKFIKILKEKRLKIFALILHFIDKLDHNHVFLLSAAIAFNILLCLIPVFLMAIFITSFFIDYTTAATTIVSTLEPLLPSSPQAQQFLKAIVTEMSLVKNFSTTAGTIALFILIWIASALLESVRESLNKIFEISTTKLFILYRLKDIVMIILVAIFILMYALVIPAFGLVVSIFDHYLPGQLGWFFSSLSVILLSILVNYTLMYLIYRFVPNGIVPKFVVNSSTVIAVVFLTISRFIFSWYLATFSNYGRFYGAYAALAAIAFWLYYSSFILLFSAQTGFFLYKLKTKKIDVDEITKQKFGKLA